MVEASSGKIKIVEHSANVMEWFHWNPFCTGFLYFDEENLMANKNKISIDLLLAADYYNIPDLIARRYVWIIWKQICQKAMLSKL